MRMRNLLFLIFFALTPQIDNFASSCQVSSVCMAYKMAGSVFIGEIDQLKEKGDDKYLATMHVVERFKGADRRYETIEFLEDREVRELVIGGRYLVFADSYNSVGDCNRTISVENKITQNDIEFLRELSSPQPKFIISGEIWLMGSGVTRENISVELSSGEKSRKLFLNDKNIFTTTVYEPGTYKVNLSLPLGTGFEMWDYPEWFDPKTTMIKNKSIVSYDIEFKPNGCDNRRIMLD